MELSYNFVNDIGQELGKLCRQNKIVSLVVGIYLFLLLLHVFLLELSYKFHEITIIVCQTRNLCSVVCFVTLLSSVSKFLYGVYFGIAVIFIS